MTSRSLPINTGSAPGSLPGLGSRTRERSKYRSRKKIGERERKRAYTELYRNGATLVKRNENYYPIYQLYISSKTQLEVIFKRYSLLRKICNKHPKRNYLNENQD